MVRWVHMYSSRILFPRETPGSMTNWTEEMKGQKEAAATLL